VGELALLLAQAINAPPALMMRAERVGATLRAVSEQLASSSSTQMKAAAPASPVLSTLPFPGDGKGNTAVLATSDPPAPKPALRELTKWPPRWKGRPIPPRVLGGAAAGALALMAGTCAVASSGSDAKKTATNEVLVAVPTGSTTAVSVPSTHASVAPMPTITASGHVTTPAPGADAGRAAAGASAGPAAPSKKSGGGQSPGVVKKVERGFDSVACKVFGENCH
jgi:hypothetical protein